MTRGELTTALTHIQAQHKLAGKSGEPRIDVFLLMAIRPIFNCKWQLVGDREVVLSLQEHYGGKVENPVYVPLTSVGGLRLSPERFND
jgi:hypothetical protein